MTEQLIKIATRQSPMALWQAECIKQQLQTKYPQQPIELVGFTTQGDQNTRDSLAQIGGKDLFVKELQQALLDEQADLAVHCIKDMSVHTHPQLCMRAVCRRDDPRDVLVANDYMSLAELPPGAVIGTASPRRKSLLLYYYPHLNIQLLRGNVNTRLSKLDSGEYDGIILAAAGLVRLQLKQRIRQYLDVDTFIPAIAQGALGIECRRDDKRVSSIVSSLNDVISQQCVTAERAVNQVLGGSCQTPIGAYAIIKNKQLHLSAMVASMDGSVMIRDEICGAADAAQTLGADLGRVLLHKGAKDLWESEDV